MDLISLQSEWESIGSSRAPYVKNYRRGRRQMASYNLLCPQLLELTPFVRQPNRLRAVQIVCFDFLGYKPHLLFSV